MSYLEERGVLGSDLRMQPPSDLRKRAAKQAVCGARRLLRGELTRITALRPDKCCQPLHPSNSWSCPDSTLSGCIKTVWCLEWCCEAVYGLSSGCHTAKITQQNKANFCDIRFQELWQPEGDDKLPLGTSIRDKDVIACPASY